MEAVTTFVTPIAILFLKMPAGRIVEVSANVLPILKAELHPSLSLPAMSPYPHCDFRRRILWPDAHRNRTLLQALFKATKGHLLRQTCLHAAVCEFARSETVKSDDVQKESEAVAYRIRVQMSALRDAKANDRSPPARYVALQALLDEIVVAPPKPSSSPPAEALLDEIAVLPDAAPAVYIPSDSEVDGAHDGGGADQYQDIDMDCFDTPAKSRKNPDSRSTPPKVVAPASAVEIDDSEMDRLLEQGAKAPDSGEYRAFSKACKKKPAGRVSVKRRPSAAVKPAGVKSSSRRLLYSKTYHSMRKTLEKQGKAPAECKSRAQAAAKSACDKAGL